MTPRRIKKTNITKQLNGTKHNVLPPPNKSWLGCGPCRITVSHYQAAARQLTEYNRAKESLWSPYGKTWTVKQDTRGLWNHQLSQYRQRTLMARWLRGTAKCCMWSMVFTRATWRSLSLIWWKSYMHTQRNPWTVSHILVMVMACSTLLWLIFRTTQELTNTDADAHVPFDWIAST